MRWLPWFLVAVIAVLTVGFGVHDIRLHGLFSRWTIAPLVMLVFLVFFVRFLTSGGQRPGAGW